MFSDIKLISGNRVCYSDISNSCSSSNRIIHETEYQQIWMQRSFEYQNNHYIYIYINRKPRTGSSLGTLHYLPTTRINND